MINLNSSNDSSWPTDCCQAPACDVPATKIEPGEPNPGNTIPTLAAPVMPVPEAALGTNAGDNATQEQPATVPEPSSTDTQQATQREPETPPERLNTHALEATQRKAETPQGPLNTDTLEATLRDATAPTPGPLAEPPESPKPGNPAQAHSAGQLLGPRQSHAIEASDDDSEYAVRSKPPPELSNAAIKQRIRRIFKPRADGSYLVADDFVQKWADKSEGGGRDQMLALFEKTAYHRAGISKMSLYSASSCIGF